MLSSSGIMPKTKVMQWLSHNDKSDDIVSGSELFGDTLTTRIGHKTINITDSTQHTVSHKDLTTTTKEAQKDFAKQSSPQSKLYGSIDI